MGYTVLELHIKQVLSVFLFPSALRSWKCNLFFMPLWLLYLELAEQRTATPNTYNLFFLIHLIFAFGKIVLRVCCCFQRSVYSVLADTVSIYANDQWGSVSIHSSLKMDHFHDNFSSSWSSCPLHTEMLSNSFKCLIIVCCLEREIYKSL